MRCSLARQREPGTSCREPAEPLPAGDTHQTSGRAALILSFSFVSLQSLSFTARRGRCQPRPGGSMRSAPPFLSTALLLALVLGSELTPRAEAAERGPHHVIVEPAKSVPMRDGVKLIADVYRPAAEGRFPVLLQ